MSFTKHQLVVFAARSSNIAKLRERVNAGGDVNRVDPRYGSRLIAAIHARRLSAIEWLLDNGADVNPEYGEQIGPLEVALRHPDPEVIGLLLRAGARLRKKVRRHYAAQLEECLKALGQAGASSAGTTNTREAVKARPKPPRASLRPRRARRRA
jgi:hypothetical protein